MISNTLSEAFGLTRLTVDNQLPAVVETAGHEKLSEDFDSSRANIRLLTKTAMTAVGELAILATQSQNHKLYDSLTHAIKAAGDLNKQLIEVHEVVREASNVKDTRLQPTQHIQNNMFISTAELQEMLQNDAKLIEQ